MTPPIRSSLDALLSSLLAQRKERNLFRSLQPPASERGLVDFSSNDYLSLSRNADIRNDYVSLIQQQQHPQRHDQGVAAEGFRLGSGGSRLLDGNSSLAESLERSLAEFHGAPAGLLFNSGYEANTGLFSAVPQAGDVVVYDEFIHASVHAGMKLSRACRMLPFRHNCVWGRQDTTGSGREDAAVAPLQETLRRLVEGRQGRHVREGRKHVFIAVEALYSMDGDLAPLDDVVECVERLLPLGNGHVVVDEAHANAVVGPGGRGLVCELGLEKRVWATVVTFGKAMGCSGAIVLCTPITRSYLINYARSFIYTTAMGFPALASIHVAHSYVASGRADAARRRLFALVQHLRAKLAALCGAGDPPSPVAVIKVGAASPCSQWSPILPVFTARARSLAAFCRSRGFLVRPIVAPTVPLGTDRVRICVHAGNTFEECDGLVRVIEAWVQGQPPTEQQSRIAGEEAGGMSQAGSLCRQDTKARL